MLRCKSALWRSLAVRELFLVPLGSLLLSAGLSAQQLPNGAPATWPINDTLPPEARQFDFWVGEWDVNLRTLQPDNSWKDTYKSVAHIFPILQGKAILELWDEASIKGYSLRYYDTRRKEWVLWLNWPGNNRSGSSSLAGNFRHGRGDFYSRAQSADGSTRISRYSFNDITPVSLRWDDGFSEDGGKTWRGNWIMEWQRTGDVPSFDPSDDVAHTWVDGSRGSLPRFREYEVLAGQRAGTVEADGEMREVQLGGYRVLDGCAVLLFVGDGPDTIGGEKFAQLTWNTGAKRFELLLLDAEPESPARLMFTAQNPEADARSWIFIEPTPAEEGSGLRVTIEVDRDGGVSWMEEREKGEEWTVSWLGTFGEPQ